jgi:UDP-N-acetylglucosamine 2-epimerase (non-hydrolysing)
MKKILIVVGTRPNFIKVTQFKKQASHFPELDVKIVHTGQHYDAKMADVFFEQFNLQPDFFLNIPAGSATRQMGEIMIRLEKCIETEYRPDLLVVVGDVNSTFAAALVANKMGIRCAHLESGLRSFDRSMPEEINRLLTDEIADIFFVTEQSGMDHLLDEGKQADQLFFVGNTMIDTLVAHRADIAKSPILSQLNLIHEPFVLMTMHRPATVDHEEGLKLLLELIDWITERYHVVFPIHPRTLKNLDKYNLLNRFTSNKRIISTEPLDYFAFQRLIESCAFVLTDSGGIQEESTFCQVPCLTLRPNTERPVTCTLGTNTLVPFELETIKQLISSIEDGSYKKGAIPPFWDGASTQRILDVLARTVML